MTLATVAGEPAVMFTLGEYERFWSQFRAVHPEDGQEVSNLFVDWVRDHPDVGAGWSEITFRVYYPGRSMSNSPNDSMLWDAASRAKERRGGRLTNFDDDGSEENQ